MSRKLIKNLIIIFAAILAAELVFVGVLALTGDREQTTLQTNPVATQDTTAAPTTEAAPSQTAGTETTAAPTETTVPETTAAPTETEPQEIRYTLTFAGDCTLGSDPGQYYSPHGFIQTIGEDYDYPFRHVADIFKNDDFTIINLESVLADEGLSAAKLFTFRGPTAYTQILTGSSVEAVTLANNHTADYGQAGYDSTTQALSDAGVWYVEEDKTTLVTTESGLVIGLYADSFYFSNADIQKNVKALKDQGAEVIICAFHWGTEGSYRATAAQQGFARAAIDAGADIVYGHHPHVLQKIEEYNDGIIFYSLGNFSFGGNNFPRDRDSAILQQEIIRDIDGSVRLGELTIIPVSISSIYKTSAQNNFQPIPYEEGSEEAARTLSKLDGSFTGPDLVVDYSNLKPTEPEEEEDDPTTPPADEGGSDAPPADEGGSDAPPADEGGSDAPPADEGGSDAPPADEGGSDTPPADEGGSDAPPADNSGSDAPSADGGSSDGGGEAAPPPAEGGDSGAEG